MNTSLVVRANRAYLYSIFFNLLFNATPISIAPLRVVVRAISNLGQPNTRTVADNGAGLDLEQVSTAVFKLYKRFHPHHPSRGIGLYLVESHIDSRGRRIAVHSQVDVGTSFTLVFS